LESVSRDQLNNLFQEVFETTEEAHRKKGSKATNAVLAGQRDKHEQEFSHGCRS
jgi:hypothetical protein